MVEILKLKIMPTKKASSKDPKKVVEGAKKSTSMKDKKPVDKKSPTNKK